MQKIINFSQIVISVFLIAVILMQNKSGGLGTVFGGEGNIFHTKRGPEKWLFYATIVLTILFIALGIVNLFVIQKAG